MASLATWSLRFPDRDPAVQTFTEADPAPGQWLTAYSAVQDARAQLPGLRYLSCDFYTAPDDHVDGYWDPNDPDFIHLRSGLPDAETRALSLHEAGHAYLHAATGTVGGEELPERFAAGDPAARAELLRLAGASTTIRIEGSRS